MNYNIKFRTDDKNDANIKQFLTQNLPYKISNFGFEWQYGNKDAIFYFIEGQNKEVLGVNGLLIYKLKSHHFSFKTAKSETSYVSEKLRGKGLFKQLYEELIIKSNDLGIDVIWGFTKLVQVWNKLGFKNYSKLLLNASLVINPSYKLQRLKFINENVTLSVLRFLFSNIKYSYYLLQNYLLNSKSGHLTAKSDLFDIDELNNFYSKLKNKYKDLILFEIDNVVKINFLDQNPYLNYKYICFYNSKNEMDGYIIYSKNNYSLNIADFHLLNIEDIDTILRLLLKEKSIFSDVYDLTFFGNCYNQNIKLIFEKLKNRGAKLFFSDMDLVVKKNIVFQNEKKFSVKNLYITLLWTECVKR